jgi:hypothetical protein
MKRFDQSYSRDKINRINSIEIKTEIQLELEHKGFLTYKIHLTLEHIQLSIIKKNTKIEVEFMKLRVRNNPRMKKKICFKASIFNLKLFQCINKQLHEFQFPIFALSVVLQNKRKCPPFCDFTAIFILSLPFQLSAP